MTVEKRGRGRPPNEETLIARQAIEAHRATKPGLLTNLVKSVKAKYDASGMGRRMAAWMPRFTSPNTTLSGLPLIRERSRDTTRNDWAGASGVQKWATTLIGIGITPRFKRVKDATRKQELNDLLTDWAAECDADGVYNLYGLQTLVVRTWFDGGEAFVRRRRRFLDWNTSVPLQLQVLEGDMVPLLNCDTYQGMPSGNVMRLGIEFDKRGQRIAYWFYKEHPGEYNQKYDGEVLVRVAASDVCHVYEPKRPGQIRGVSESAAVLTRLRNTADFDDTVLERQKIANLFVGFITRTLPVAGEVDRDPLTNEPLDAGGGSPLLGLQPGLIQELDDGQTMNWSNPPEAGTNYGEYMRTQNLGTAAGWNIPYELHSGDIANVSDRTLRVLINEFRRLAEQRQWQVVIPMFCQPAINWFVEAAVLAGKVGVDEADTVRRVEHSPHGWPNIHPTQDPQGKQIEIQMGTRSRSSVISERGDDPDQVDAERKADMEREKALGLPNETTQPAQQQQTQQGAGQ